MSHLCEVTLVPSTHQAIRVPESIAVHGVDWQAKCLSIAGEQQNKTCRTTLSVWVECISEASIDSEIWWNQISFLNHGGAKRSKELNSRSQSQTPNKLYQSMLKDPWSSSITMRCHGIPVFRYSLNTKWPLVWHWPMGDVERCSFSYKCNHGLASMCRKMNS